jgi:hypothetical protein
MSEQRYRGQRAAWLLIGLVVACLLAASVAASLRPRRFTSHQETVSYVLNQHGIAHAQVRVVQTFTGLLQRDAYAAGIVVQLSDGREVQGSIECKVHDTLCWLDMGMLGMTHERLPELGLSDRWLWLGWLERHLKTYTDR